MSTPMEKSLIIEWNEGESQRQFTDRIRSLKQEHIIVVSGDIFDKSKVKLAVLFAEISDVLVEYQHVVILPMNCVSSAQNQAKAEYIFAKFFRSHFQKIKISSASEIQVMQTGSALDIKITASPEAKDKVLALIGSLNPAGLYFTLLNALGKSALKTSYYNLVLHVHWLVNKVRSSWKVRTFFRRLEFLICRIRSSRWYKRFGLSDLDLFFRRVWPGDFQKFKNLVGEEILEEKMTRFMSTLPWMGGHFDQSLYQKFSTEIQDLKALRETLMRLESVYSGLRVEKSLQQVHLTEVVKTDKQRIIFVSAMFPTRGHAGGLRLFDMIEALKKRGHEIFLFTVTPEREEQDCMTHLNTWLTGSKLVNSSIFRAENLKAWIDELKITFDVGHFEYPGSSDLLAIESSLIRKKIFTFMEAVTKRLAMDFSRIFAEISAGGSLPGNVGMKLKELLDMSFHEKQACQFADALICVTDDDAEFVLKYFGQKCFVVPSGVSPTLHTHIPMNSKLALSPHSVGFLGHYGHYPNIDGVRWYLEEVHPHVLQGFPNYQFHIFGKGDLKAIRRQYRLDTSVVIRGPVEDVCEAIVPMGICVAPLISGAGFRGKINQYSYFSKPVVTTSIGVSGLPYTHGRDIFVSDNPQVFAENILSLLKDENLRKEMGLKAKDVCSQEFTWEKPIAILEDIYLRAQSTGYPN